MKIVLDSAEEKIRGLLLQFAREFGRRGNPQVTLRFTGGWVRDKLLGRPSHDIDVAIDKTTGEEFATALHNYLVDIDGSGSLETGGVHKIASNPEKSKHLETATTKICGLDIDFVNLRSEEYADSSSRVPTTVKFGTPREDALRRDATLNALFYNLSTDSVEDFTGRGLEDLRSGTLRTPLEPAVTFNDDPLRVLRLIRFAGQLGFTIAPETLEAMHGDTVGSLLRLKVSGERVGSETQKLVEAPHAICGLRYIVNLGLGPHIFALPSTVPNAPLLDDPDLGNRVETMNTVIPQLSSALKPQAPEQQGIMWLAVILQPWKDTRVPVGKANKTEDAVSLIVKEGLKLTKAAKDGVAKLLDSTAVIDSITGAENMKCVPRHVLGSFVRAAGPSWQLCLAYNAVRLNSPATMNSVAQLIADAGLAEAYSLRPLLDGKQAAKLLERKPGPWLQPVLAAAMEYQLDHPEASSEEVERFVVTISAPDS